MMNAPVDPAVAVIVVAAGSGTRLGEDLPKAFVDLDGRSVLQHALRGVVAVAPAQVVVVAPAGFEGLAEIETARACAAEALPLSTTTTRVVTGGATRQLSVAAGLAALDPGITRVLVHDAARALTPSTQIAAVAAAVTEEAGAIPALPVVDTLKRVDGDRVEANVDRSVLAAAQTPQGFPRRLLVEAYRLAGEREHTDDAALFAAAGHPVRRVPGDERAFKITTPADRERARLLLGASSGGPGLSLGGTAPGVRIGIGTDAHAFGGEGPLWLAGIEWPGEAALSGHSDGDAVAHALVDALLGAAGLGDIGTFFGTAQAEYAGAHAEVFLTRTREILAAAGWGIVSVSAQFQGNRPRFAARRAEAEGALSRALGGAPVSVTATTTDGLGFPGRGEGIAVTAVALVQQLASSSVPAAGDVLPPSE